MNKQSHKGLKSSILNLATAESNTINICSPTEVTLSTSEKAFFYVQWISIMCDELACDDVLIYTCAWTLAYELTSRVLLTCDSNFLKVHCLDIIV